MALKFLFFAIAYLIGSVPTAILYSKVFFGKDIRELGSGNAGATNSLRVFGKKAGATVLLIDVLKGFLLVFLYNYFFDSVEESLLIGIVAVLGHIYSVFSGFKGGKGVATALGAILAVYPLGALTSILIFVIIVVITRYVSLSSILAAVSFAVIYSFVHFSNIYLIALSWFLALLLIYTHRENIKKLINGTENRFSKSKK